MILLFVFSAKKNLSETKIFGFEKSMQTFKAIHFCFKKLEILSTDHSFLTFNLLDFENVNAFWKEALTN